MFMHNPRYHALLSVFPTLGASGPLTVSSAFTFPGDPSFFTDNIRCSPTGDPLGSLGDLGWYNVRISLAAFNYDMPDYASGVMVEKNDSGVPITITGSLRYKDGRCFTFTSSFKQGLQQWCRVAGEGKVLCMEDFVIPWDPKVSEYRVVGEEFVDETTRCERAEEVFKVECEKAQEVLMWEEFGRRVRERREHGKGGGREGMKDEVMTQICVDSVLKSAREGGREVKVDKNLW